MAVRLLFFLFLFAAVPRKGASQLRLPRQTDSAATLPSFRILLPNFYNRTLGFVCRKEYQLQKLTSLPVYFRLGSKAYVDYLERKPNAVFIKP